MSVIAGRSSEELAERIARKLKARLVRTDAVSFPDGEGKLTLRRSLSGTTAIVVQSVQPPVDTNLVQALSLIAKAKESASKVIAVVPYMGYARQDREFLPGEVVTMKVLAGLFRGAGASKIVMVDIHSRMGLRHFGKGARNVTAVRDLARYFGKKRLRTPLVVSPDQGGAERAREFAGELGLNHIALTKQRDRKTGRVRITTRDIDSVKGIDLIIVDDMISTGGSIIKAAEFLKSRNCGRVYVACTHGLFVNDARKKIRGAGVTEIVSTNTVPGPTAKVDVSGAIAGAIE